MPNPSHTGLDVIRNEAIRLDGDTRDYEALLDSTGERSLVLLGEATHGTREFYRMRAELTLRLVAEKRFDAVAVEADWPDAYRLNRFVRGEGHDQAARSAFDDFQRFPRWMWRNEEVLGFVERLRDINMTRQANDRIGFGLFHCTRLDRFYPPMQGEAARVLRDPLLERAIGVLYRADTEYESHYFMASIAAQFDAVFHLDETTAVEPLDTAAARLEIQPL